jgi:3-oxoacyl-[acyl-carrier-protein] synthase-3
MSKDNIGIAGLGYYLPTAEVDAWQLVKDSKISREKFEAIGVESIHQCLPDQLPSDMAVSAGRQAFDRAGIEPNDVDLMIYCGSLKDHARWQAEAKVQSALGCNDCFGFDLYQSGNGQSMSLKVVHDMLLGDHDLKVGVIAAAERWDTSLEPPILGHSFIFGDGASVAVLKKNHPDLVILSTAQMTIGQHHEMFCIPEIGTWSKTTVELLERGGHLYQFYKTLDEVVEDKRSFIETFIQNGIDLFGQAAEQAGLQVSQLDYVVMPNTSRKHNCKFLDKLGHDPKRSSLDFARTSGLLGTADVFYNLQRAIEEKQISKGELVALYSVGAGYSLAVTILKY